MTHWNFDRMAAAVFDAAYPPILGNPPDVAGKWLLQNCDGYRQLGIAEASLLPI